MIPTVVDETPNCLIIHGAWDNIGNKAARELIITNNILDLAKKCRHYDVNEGLIFSIICKRTFSWKKRLKQQTFFTKASLQWKCLHLYRYVNINKSDLSKDGLHLLEYENLKLSDDYINSWNIYWQPLPFTSILKINSHTKDIWMRYEISISNTQRKLRRVTRGGRGEVYLALFQKFEKSALILGKNALIVVTYG